MPAIASLSLALLFASAAAAQEPNPATQAVPEPPPPEPFDLAAALAEGPPMTADRAATMAVRSAPTLEQARALSRMSEASVARARAAMLPRLDLSASYMHVDGFPNGQISTGPSASELAAAQTLAGRVTDPAARALWQGSLSQQANGGFTFVIPRDRFNFGAQLSWPVSDLFFAMMPALDAAEANGRMHQRQVEATEAQVARSAREAFYQLARARGGLAVARQARIQAEAQQARIEAGVRAGFLTESDRLAAEARVASADQMIATAEAGVIVADAALRVLIGQSDGQPYGIAEPLIDAEPGDAPAAVSTLTAQALDQRPEILALREALTAQRAAAQASDASGYPHVALVAGANVANPNPYVIPPTAHFYPYWQLGAQLSWSPNDTLNAVHRGQELAAQYEATQAQLGQLQRAVTLEVRQSHASIRAAQRSLESARVALRAAEAAYESRESEMRGGNATVADLFVSANELDRARLAVLDAAIQLRLGRAQLAYAVGH